MEEEINKLKEYIEDLEIEKNYLETKNQALEDTLQQIWELVRFKDK